MQDFTFNSRRKFIKVAGAGMLALPLAGVLQSQAALAASPGSNAFVAQSALNSVSAANTPDPQMQAVLDELSAFNAPPIETTIPEIARQLPSATDAVMAVLSKQNKPTVEPVARVEHRVFQGPGSPLVVRIYTPAGSGPFPVIVYFHGGGWVIANLDTYDPSCRGLTNAAKAIVVSVAYRQAPEHKFPAAPDDSFAAYKWVLANAASFNGDPNRVAVAGESAGGNLAAVTSIMARDGGVKLPVFQLLVYPVTDFSKEYTSYQEFANAKPLNTAGLKWFGMYYLRSDTDKTNPRASVLLTPNLKGLPPTWLVTAEIDPLRDQGEDFKTWLIGAGNKVGGARYTGVTHEFFGMGAAVDTAKKALAEAAFQLKVAFGTA